MGLVSLWVEGAGAGAGAGEGEGEGWSLTLGDATKQEPPEGIKG